MMDVENHSRMQTDPEQPSVLDWFHSIIRLKPIPIPEAGENFETESEGFDSRPVPVQANDEPVVQPGEIISWKAFLFPVGFLLILLAQAVLLRMPESIGTAVLLLIAAVLIGWYFQEETLPSFRSTAGSSEASPVQVNLALFGVGLLLSIATFLLAGSNRFTILSTTTWMGSIVFTALAFCKKGIPLDRWLKAVREWLGDPCIEIHLGREEIVILLIFILSFFLRFFRLENVPVEMWSDQAEKLLDVADVLDGQYSIFFLRNTGREALQFYLSAFIARVFGTGISFLTLKIGTALLGFLTLPFIYLFARETVGQKAAGYALFLAGIAYWPNIISRAGLRFPLYPVFAAPAMYFLVRGIRRRRISDFVWSGIAVGFGLHGYSPARVIPLVILAGVLVYMAHSASRGWRRHVITFLIATGIVALVILMPLLRVAVDMPDQFLFRMLSRMGEVEREFPGNPAAIFFKNLWDALLMFNVDNGEIWILGPTHRPAFDWITGALFMIGLVLVTLRYVQNSRWTDLYLLISIPLLLLPSILSLAFPSENPALNRASGAMIPAFAAAGFAAASLSEWFRNTVKRSRLVEYALISTLLIVSLAGNYRIVFSEYAEQMEGSVWNTSDAGRVLKAFAQSTGSYDTGHVVAYPHWMDTRLVGMHAGKPRKDYAIWPDELHTLADVTDPQMFIVNPMDEEGLSKLQELFPDGVVKLYNSPVEGHDFLIYSVP